MEEGTFAGVPLYMLGLICMCLALLWYFVWPKDNTPKPLKQLPEYRPRPVWMHDVLRWFHMLVWMLLATTCFFVDAGQTTLAGACALLAGVFYVVFVVTLIKDRQRQKANEREGIGS
jgi:hypothetical protein